MYEVVESTLKGWSFYWNFLIEPPLSGYVSLCAGFVPQNKVSDLSLLLGW